MDLDLRYPPLLRYEISETPLMLFYLFLTMLPFDPLEPISDPRLHGPLIDQVEKNIFRVEYGRDMAYFRADCGVFAGSSVGNSLFSMGVWPTQGA